MIDVDAAVEIASLKKQLEISNNLLEKWIEEAFSWKCCDHVVPLIRQSLLAIGKEIDE